MISDVTLTKNRSSQWRYSANYLFYTCHARKLKLDKLPKLINFAEHTKILPGSLKMRKRVKIFLQNTSIFARRPKEGEKSQRFSKFFL